MNRDILVLAMVLCVIALMVILFKYIKKDGSEESFRGRKKIPRPESKKNLQSNNVFFNNNNAFMAKSTRLVVRNENKIYFLINMGDDKVLVMEEDPYIPNPEDGLAMEKNINTAEYKEGDDDFEGEDLDNVVMENAMSKEQVSKESTNVNYEPEVKDLQNLQDISNEDLDVESIKEIMRQTESDNKAQENLFDLMQGSDGDQENESY